MVSEAPMRISPRREEGAPKNASSRIGRNVNCGPKRMTKVSSETSSRPRASRCFKRSKTSPR